MGADTRTNQEKWSTTKVFWVSVAAFVVAALLVFLVIELTCDMGTDTAVVCDNAAKSAECPADRPMGNVVCAEEPGGRPRGKPANLVELRPNTSRASVLMSLGYHQQLADDIGFVTKKGVVTVAKRPKGKTRLDRLKRRNRVVTATVVDWPRTASERLDADIAVEATPSPLGNRVYVKVCVERDSDWAAGQYEGAVGVYGTKVGEFTYPIVVTAKWPPCIPILVLMAAIAAFLLMALATKSLTFGLEDNKWPAGLLGLGIAVAAAGLTYWGQYGKNATWGEDPGAQITALAVAGFTAAVGGLAASQRLLRPDEKKKDPGGEQKAGSQGAPDDPHNV